jgi:hypothetical protein
MDAPDAVVVHLNIERAARAPMPAKLLRENVEAIKLAPWLHSADVELGRCPNVLWHDLDEDQQQEKVERAAVAIRLADPIATAAMVERAAACAHRLLGRVTLRALVARSLETALAHLRGHIGGQL